LGSIRLQTFNVENISKKDGGVNSVIKKNYVKSAQKAVAKS
jgi:hypothetical protein